MSKKNRFDVLDILTNNTALIWKKARGTAADSVADKLDKAMLDWQGDLTRTLRIWIDKGLTMTNGELILARSNLGAVVESWLKFYYCVFYEDYLKNPLTNNRGIMIAELLADCPLFSFLGYVLNA